MSFSYGIGDALAIINLIERVVVEVRNYRDAPRYFQHLALELQLLQRALQRLLEVEACDDSELRQLEEIRAIAMHCRQPLLDFCDKMRSSEAGLGSMQSTRTLSAIGKRLHWSLVTRKDVDALRQAVVSEMTTINMLLALQQLDSIKKLISLNDQANTSTIHLREFCSVSSEYFMTSMGIMKEVGRTSAAIEQFSDIVSRKLADHDRSAHQIREEVTRVSASMSSLTVFAQSVSNLTRSMEGYVTRMLRTVASLASDLGKIVMMIAQLSKRVAKKLASQGKMLREIHAMMKRVLKAVEAIPLHITLPIVRLDDALGESWALPYQVCQTYQSFQHILQTLVYGNGRIGSLRIALGLFLLRSAESRQLIDSDNWRQLIKEGSRISQAMVVCSNKTGYPRQSSQNKNCPFLYCHGRITGNGEVCVLCGRVASFISELSTQVPGFRAAGKLECPEPVQMVHGPENIRLESTASLYDPLGVDGACAFRDIAFKDSVNARGTSSSFELISKNPMDASANECIGSWLLSEEIAVSPTGLGATEHLSRACFISPFDAEKYYRLARSFVRQQNWLAALNAYKRAVFLQPSSPTIWMSGGVLLFGLGLFRDSLMTFARSLRLCQDEAIPWLNIGILYERCGQGNFRQAIESYRLYLEKISRYEDERGLQHDMHGLQAHVDELEEFQLQNRLPLQTLNMVQPHLKTFTISLNGPTDDFLSPLEQQLLDPDRLKLVEPSEEETFNRFKHESCGEWARLLELGMAKEDATSNC